MFLETLMAGYCFMGNPELPSEPLFTPQLQVEYPKLPKKVTISDKLVRGARSLDTGAFHAVPSNLPAMNKAALKLSVESLIVEIKKGGADGFKALITALRLSGITIATVNGDLEAHPERDQGIRLTLWKLQMFAGQDNLTNEIPLVNSLKAGSLLIKNVSPEALAQSFVSDLQSMSKDQRPGVAYFSQVINQLANQDESPSYLGVEANKREEIEKIKVTPLQLALIGLRMEAELLVRSKGLPTPKSKSRPVLLTASCVPNDNETVKDPARIKETNHFEGTFKSSGGDSDPSSALKNLIRFANFLSSQPGILGVLTAIPEMNVIGGEPLVRTKTSTAGEQKTLEISWRPGYRDRDQQNCLREYLATVGLSLGNNLGDDFLKGAKAKLRIETVNERERLFFDAHNPNTKFFTVDEKSKISTSIIGMPQPRKIPANAKSALVTVPITLSLDLDVMRFISSMGDNNSDMLKAYSMLQSQAAGVRERTNTVTLKVRDWIPAPEGTFIANIRGDYFSSNYKADAASKKSEATSVKYRSKSKLKFSEKSSFLPTIPDGVPLPPGIPEEDLSPMLMIQDTFDYKMVADVFTFNQQAYICDMCKPDSGFGRTTYQTVETKFSHQEKVTPYLMVSKPIKFIKSKKLAITEIEINEVKVSSRWKSAKETLKCPVSDDDGDNGGDYEDEEKKLGEFELAIPYEVADGMAYLQGTYVTNFGFNIDYYDGQSTDIPAKLELEIDMIVPLP